MPRKQSRAFAILPNGTVSPPLRTIWCMIRIPTVVGLRHCMPHWLHNPSAFHIIFRQSLIGSASSDLSGELSTVFRSLLGAGSELSGITAAAEDGAGAQLFCAIGMRRARWDQRHAACGRSD